MFHGELRHELAEVREALALDPEIPVTACDARDRPSSIKAMPHLVTYASTKSRRQVRIQQAEGGRLRL
jgi:uncharacterized protein